MALPVHRYVRPAAIRRAESQKNMSTKTILVSLYARILRDFFSRAGVSYEESNTTNGTYCKARGALPLDYRANLIVLPAND